MSEHDRLARRYAGEWWLWRLLILGPRSGWRNVTRAAVMTAFLALLALLAFAMATSRRGLDVDLAAGFLGLAIGSGLIALWTDRR